MDCPRCGAPVQQGMQFCSVCGAQAGAAVPPPSQQYPAQQQYPQYAYPQQPYPPQPYPYQYPPAQPYAPQKDDASSIGKVIAIVLVLLVVFVVIGAVIFYLFVASVEDFVDEFPDAADVTMGSPAIEQRLVNGTWYYDATFVIDTVSQSAGDFGWAAAHVTLEMAIGLPMLEDAVPMVDSPPDYDDASDGLVRVQAWYADADRNGAVSPGDRLKLTGMTTMAEGGQVELAWDFVVVAIETLPTDFQ